MQNNRFKDYETVFLHKYVNILYFYHMKGIEFESNLQQMLLGFHYMDYFDEDGNDGKVFEVGLLFFKINIYL